MVKTRRFSGSVLIAFILLFPGAKIFGLELAPHVLAQVEESGGFRTGNHHAVRIFDDGKIEKLEAEKWADLGRLSAVAVARLKRVTEVMTPKNKLYTKDSEIADGPAATYSVRNKEGEVVVIGRKGNQEAILLQGGASAIIQVLDGLNALAWIDY